MKILRTSDRRRLRHRPPRRYLLVLAAALFFVACGEGDSSDGQQSPVTTAAEEGDTERPVITQPETDVVTEGLTADAIPVAHTPEGGYGDQVPPPVLADCTEPLVDDAVDLRGWWEMTELIVGGEASPSTGVRQRIEQCGDRVVITAGGVVHDMRADGTEENGVNDVAERDFTTPITVVATFEDGVHVLRPVGLPIEVTRTVVGGELLWNYAGIESRSTYLGPPDEDPQADEPLGEEEATPTPPISDERFSIRGMRYCEILLLFDGDGEPTGEVWGTQGVNLCPAEAWEAIDPEAVRTQFGATQISMNGPRYFVIDLASGAQLPDGERRVYGDLEMQQLATLPLPVLPSAAGRGNHSAGRTRRSPCCGRTPGTSTPAQRSTN